MLFFDLIQYVRQHGTWQASKNDIFLTQKNTSQCGLQSVCYFGAKCWNDIPMDIRNHPLQSVFVVNSKLSSLKIIITVDPRILGTNRSPSAVSFNFHESHQIHLKYY